jgi:putative nucleotidyltransferase with HDIG domain
MAGFLKGKQEGYGLGEGELWRHAVISAKVAGILAQKCNHSRDRHRIFTAALLKDIGKLVLGRFVAFSYERINISVQSKGASFNEAEKDIIGISHEELGAQIAERWRFSDQMIFNIRHHHLLDASARDHVETILIYLADMVCMMMGVHAGVDGLAYLFYGEVLTAMHLTEKDLQTVMVETLQMRDHIEDMLKLF